MGHPRDGARRAGGVCEGPSARVTTLPESPASLVLANKEFQAQQAVRPLTSDLGGSTNDTQARGRKARA